MCSTPNSNSSTISAQLNATNQANLLASLFKGDCSVLDLCIQSTFKPQFADQCQIILGFQITGCWKDHSACSLHTMMRHSQDNHTQAASPKVDETQRKQHHMHERCWIGPYCGVDPHAPTSQRSDLCCSAPAHFQPSRPVSMSDRT